MLLVQKKSVKETVRANGIDRGHDDLRVGLADWDLVRILCLHPIGPAKFVSDERKIKQRLVL